MARILYAASGDGYGHAVRLHSVGAGLLDRGHDVRFLSSEKTSVYLRRLFPDRVHDVFGLLTIYQQGRAEPLRTLMHNLRRAWSALSPSNLAIRQLIRRFKPDLVITDFEPFAAFWTQWSGVPYVSLDNQHLLTHCELEHPSGCMRDLVNAYLTIRLYYAGAKRYLIPTFYQAPIRFHPTRLVAPILRPRVYEMASRDEGFILAYKGAGGENDAMRRALERYDRLPIRAYGFGVEGRRRHVHFKRTDPDGFLDDLTSCRAVISTAGHSLVCEALHLEKPMLLLPIKQQYEQLVNARHVERMGVGRSCDRLRPRVIEEFVGGLEGHRAALRATPKASLESVLDAVEREIP
jgi:uncharacterized protein (TIGR00661 family)